MNEKNTLKSELNNNPFGIKHALRGLGIFFLGRNSKAHLTIFILVLILGVYLGLSKIEWLFIAIVVGIVFITEAINTAIEIDIDLTSPDYHPFARDAKDVAAAAVLISILLAIVVGLFVFLPYFLDCIHQIKFL